LQRRPKSQKLTEETLGAHHLMFFWGSSSPSECSSPNSFQMLKFTRNTSNNSMQSEDGGDRNFWPKERQPCCKTIL